ncbi:MAG: Serine/threonine-protein kinase [Chaenotheca gracillima]|nr:MAG: Serine/threonine-protein kinase [Chaenotheca gracillima]
MAKRKELSQPGASKDAQEKETANASDDSGSEDDASMLNVDFEWFDPQPEHDFHGLKILLRQLFDVDAQLFDLSALADLILSQPLLGSTVKVEGNESDPYAFLSIINLHAHRDKSVIKDLTTHIARKASSVPALSQTSELLSAGSSAQIGLILTERMINIPSEVSPPMYTMLLEEISWAIEDKEPYEFTHYLVISKTYSEVASKLDEQDARPQKKSKKAAAGSETFYFHPEDEVLQQHALSYGSFPYTTDGDGTSDSKRTFQELGIKPQGHMILIEAAKFKDAVEAVGRYLNPVQ